MGYGEVIGNQSVHWRIVHEDYTAAAGDAQPSGQVRRARLGADAQVPGSEAEAAGNLEVLDFEARGVDRIDFDEIGKGNGKKNHPGKFRVVLRFENQDDAAAALKAATVTPVQVDGRTMYVLQFDVPAIRRRGPDVGPPATPPSEVRVDW